MAQEHLALTDRAYLLHPVLQLGLQPLLFLSQHIDDLLQLLLFSVEGRESALQLLFFLAERDQSSLQLLLFSQSLSIILILTQTVSLCFDSLQLLS